MSSWRIRALAAIDNKTKPSGSLGRLEQLAVDIAEFQGTLRPDLDPVAVVVFAADHGIAAAGVSAYPQSVTAQMVRNFSNGGAAINVLAGLISARLEVVNVGVASALEPMTNVVDAHCGPGTANFVDAPAMTSDQLAAAFEAGRAAVARCEARLLVLGEMGIGNTSSATALVATLLGIPALAVVGPGTGLNVDGIQRKAMLISQAITRVGADQRDPLVLLRELGGFEIVALAGAMQAASGAGILVLVDGFVASAAALFACAIDPDCRRALVFAHRSAEPGHDLVLEALGARPLLDLGMRLGEGSGAALAVPLLQAACAILRDMASFESAQISRALA